jgi:hypothetical protein
MSDMRVPPITRVNSIYTPYWVISILCARFRVMVQWYIYPAVGGTRPRHSCPAEGQPVPTPRNASTVPGWCSCRWWSARSTTTIAHGLSQRATFSHDESSDGGWWWWTVPMVDRCPPRPTTPTVLNVRAFTTTSREGPF